MRARREKQQGTYGGLWSAVAKSRLNRVGDGALDLLSPSPFGRGVGVRVCRALDPLPWPLSQGERGKNPTRFRSATSAPLPPRTSHYQGETTLQDPRAHR